MGGRGRKVACFGWLFCAAVGTLISLSRYAFVRDVVLRILPRHAQSHVVESIRLKHTRSKSLFRIRLKIIALICVFLTGLFANPLIAATASVDYSFGEAGLLTTSGDARLVVRPDGSIYSGRTCVLPSGQTVCLSRYDRDGKLDVSFGAQGTALVSRAYQLLGSFAHAAGNHIYVAALCTGAGPCIARITLTGSVDTTFGVDGYIDIEGLEPTYYVTLIAPRPDGSFVSIGSCWRNNVFGQCFADWDASGNVETVNGISFAPMSGELFRAAYASDHSLVVAGMCLRNINAYAFNKRCLLKLTPEARVDTRFGAGGLVTNDQFESTEWVTDMVIDQDDRILVSITGFGVGQFYGCQFGCNLLFRLNVDGVPDASFLPPAELWELGANAVAVDRFGRYIVLSAENCVSQSSRCVGRLNPSGSFDTSFISNMRESPFFTFTPPMQGNWLGQISFVRSTPSENGWMIVAAGCQTPTESGYCVRRIRRLAGRYDLDSDGDSVSASDAILYVRHLLGFHDTALTSGALGTYADRTSATDIATYLSTPNTTYPNCSASIVGAPGGPQAMLDGIVLLRAMMGLTGDAVTNGIAFPAGTARTSWVDIKAHLNDNCVMAFN